MNEDYFIVIVFNVFCYNEKIVIGYLSMIEE